MFVRAATHLNFVLVPTNYEYNKYFPEFTYLLLDFHFDLEEVLAPLYPHLRYEGKLSNTPREEVQSLRSPARLQQQDSEDFQTEDFFQNGESDTDDAREDEQSKIEQFSNELNKV